jgi:hypothetical protein
MRPIRQVLRLHLEAGLTCARVGRALGVPKSTAGKFVLLARAASVDWGRHKASATRSSKPGCSSRRCRARHATSSPTTPCLALARITYLDDGDEGHIILVKPNLCGGLPVDLFNFKAEQPAFPQQSTSDQFFDEAQWESYFQLGTALGEKLSLASVSAILANSLKLRSTADPMSGSSPEPRRPDALGHSQTPTTVSYGQATSVCSRAVCPCTSEHSTADPFFGSDRA